MSKWISVSERMPKIEQAYDVKIERNGEKLTGKRTLRHGLWWGGLRPFSDKDVITHWKEE